MKKRTIIITVSALAAAIAAACVYLFGFYLPDRRSEEEANKIIRDYYAAKFAQYESENAEYEDFEVDVAFLGDSLTDGYDVKNYYPQYTVSNRGIGGETTFGLEERIKVSLYDLKPKVAVILIGVNNIDTMLENYERMLIGIKENLPETHIVLCSLTSMGGSWGYRNQTAAYNNVTLKKLAEKHGFAFVDLYYPLFNLATGEIYEEYTTDGGHLTAKGYEVLTAAITPAIESLLGR